MTTMIEKVAKAIYEKRNGKGCTPWAKRGMAHKVPYFSDARAAIEAMPLEQLVSAAYVRGVEWNEENPLDREYRFKASLDYADKTLFDALSEEHTE